MKIGHLVVGNDCRYDVPTAYATCFQCGCGLSDPGMGTLRLAIQVLSRHCQCAKTPEDEQVLAAHGIGLLLQWLAPEVEREIWRRKVQQEHKEVVELHRRLSECGLKGWDSYRQSVAPLNPLGTMTVEESLTGRPGNQWNLYWRDKHLF